MSSSQIPSEFESDGARYELGRMLGRGNAGAVYLAMDRETGEQVALKKLFRIDTKSVLRLKREFRSLQNIHHPNLVKLYDLGRTGEAWFLTMEYIEGADLLRYLEAERVSTVKSEVPYGRLVGAFMQLANGVHALHRAGMLHRDLKPSNVLVSNGRVVALDFGLVRELEEADLLVTHDGTISGTPAYMPPEQALGHKLSEKSDWYAVGVMLYQALSGRLPIDGRNANELLRKKLEREAPPLEGVDPPIPARLNRLCMRMLQRDPNDRPSGDEVLEVLSWVEPDTVNQDLPQQHGEVTLQTELKPRQAAAPLFGREGELSRLHEALDHARRGEPLVLHVRGASGAGKSALVEYFLEQIERDAERLRYQDALVLRSRCYEREAMPFKALDGVMDALVRHLSQLDDFDVAHLLPADVAELAQLFPALDRLRAVQHLLANAKPRGDAVQARQRAETALRDLFGRLSSSRLVVLWIDDLQWGDLDSATVLESWLRQVAKTPLLVVLSYRSEEMLTSSCLNALLRKSAPRGPMPATERTIELEALEDTDVELLCEQRLGVRAYSHPELVARIVQEARCNPFLASQLTALAEVKLGRRDADLSALSMEELVVQSTALLPAGARAILNVLAVAGRPILPQVALQAAGVQRDGNAHLHALKSLRLTRSREVGTERRIEVYHDRVREGVQATLSASERERVSDRLLRVLELSSHADADWLHVLSLAAGQHVPALRYGMIAAERANSTLAFERAAELYSVCIELTKPAAVSGELWLKLALALARCRRGTQAAHAYLEAAKHADVGQVVPLMRSAASHLMRTGHYEQGEQLLEKVLQVLKLDVPKSERGLLAAIAWERMRLSLAGSNYTPRIEAEVPPELLERCEVFAMLSVDTLGYDPLLAALFQARCQRAALSAGDPTSLVRAWCVAASFNCVSGSARAEQATEELLNRAATLCKQLGRERLMRYVHAARAICNFLLGKPALVEAHATEAERLYGEDAIGDTGGEYFHQFTVMAAHVISLLALGDYPRFLRELDLGLEKARAIDNRAIQHHLALAHAVADRVRDQAELSRPRLDAQRPQLPSKRFGVLHVMHVCGVMTAGCSTGELAWARGVVDAMWPQFLKSYVHESAHLALLAHALHARMLLNEFVREPGAKQPEALIRADLQAIERSPFKGAASATVKRLQARLAWLEGRKEDAAALFRSSAAAFDAASSPDEALRDRHALGLTIGGAEGAQLCAATLRSLRELGVVQPSRELEGFFPELFR